MTDKKRVQVRTPKGEKSAQVDGSTPDSLARSLLIDRIHVLQRDERRPPKPGIIQLQFGVGAVLHQPQEPGRERVRGVVPPVKPGRSPDQSGADAAAVELPRELIASPRCRYTKPRRNARATLEAR